MKNKQPPEPSPRDKKRTEDLIYHLLARDVILFKCHKLRTTLFYQDMQNFSVARAQIKIWHPHVQKPIHCPAYFKVLSALTNLIQLIRDYSRP